MPRVDTYAELVRVLAAAEEEDYAALGAATPEEEVEEFEPNCDICGWNETYFGPGDWNGETGNHIACEDASYGAPDDEDDDGGPTRDVCRNQSCACNAPMYVPKPEDKVDVRKFVEENGIAAA